MSKEKTTSSEALPLISIIIPAYNAESYLERCISSIQDQTYTHLEMIIVNDGSTDSTAQICDALSLADDRIRVIHQNNMGPSCARNNALRTAKGEYLVYVDSDDYIGPTHIENLLETLREAGAKLAITGTTFVYTGAIPPEARQKIKPTSCCVIEAEEAACVAIESTSLPFAEHACGKLYSAELTPYLHFPEGKNWEDQFIMYKVILAAKKIAYENANDYYYAQDQTSSLSRTRDERFLDTLDARREAMAFAIVNHHEELEKTASKKYYARIIGLYGDLSLAGQKGLAEKVYQLIKNERQNALSSPYPALTTKTAYALSFLPKTLFSHIVRFMQSRIEKQKHTPSSST